MTQGMSLTLLVAIDHVSLPPLVTADHVITDDVAIEQAITAAFGLRESHYRFLFPSISSSTLMAVGHVITAASCRKACFISAVGCHRACHYHRWWP
jgi:hypothetical protein